MKTAFTKTFFTLYALAVMLSIMPTARAQEIQKTLRVGQSDVYVFDRMTTAAVGSPLVADIVPLSSRRLLVNAKNLGQTTLFVCDHAGTHRLGCQWSRCRLTCGLRRPKCSPPSACRG